MSITFRIKSNLHLKGNKIISYTTHVATIKGDKIYELGKFTRTTSKQIQFLAKLLELEIVPNKNKQVFFQYDYGTQCHFKGALKFKLLKTINQYKKQGYKWTNILAIIKSDCTEQEWKILSQGRKIDQDLIKGSQLLKKFSLF